MRHWRTASGIWQVKWQLEDLSFRHLEPEKYRDIASKLQSRRQSREKHIAHVVQVLEDELKSHGLKAEVSGRAKHIYSISRKMQAAASRFQPDIRSTGGAGAR